MPTSPISPVPIAYSLARVIPSQKLSNDRRARLKKISETYAAAHGLTIDTTFRPMDLGKSAFKGKNPDGPVSQWLQAVNQGIIAPGAVFFVESLDGQQDQKTFNCLLEIINCGHTVVTFPDQIAHDSKSIAANPAILVTTFAMMVAQQQATETRRQIARQAIPRKRPEANE